jgi:hypothetical protein
VRSQGAAQRLIVSLSSVVVIVWPERLRVSMLGVAVDSTPVEESLKDDCRCGGAALKVDDPPEDRVGRDANKVWERWLSLSWEFGDAILGGTSMK